MLIAFALSFLLVGSFFFGFYVVSYLIIMLDKDPEQKNQAMTKNIPDRRDWGWSNDYCLKKLKFKDSSIIYIPKCKL